MDKRNYKFDPWLICADWTLDYLFKYLETLRALKTSEKIDYIAKVEANVNINIKHFSNVYAKWW